MNPKARKLYSVIRNIRTCFNLLKALADEMHEDLGITASMRAVLESLADEDEQTVPQIARTKGVSRQHIQVIVDALTKGAFVVLRDNPAHKRSALVALTNRGQSTFKEIRRREQAILEKLADDLPLNSLETTLKTLDVFKDILFQTIRKGAHHEIS